MAAVASFTFVKGQFDAFVSGAAGLKDMSERTGETVEKLSGLVAVAKIGGHPSKASKRHAQAHQGHGGADEETKGAGHALEFLGIKSRDSEGKLKSSGDMIVEIFKKLAQFKDGPGKAAVAMDLFGKSGAQLRARAQRLGGVKEIWSSRSRPNRQSRPISTKRPFAA